MSSARPTSAPTPVQLAARLIHIASLSDGDWEGRTGPDYAIHSVSSLSGRNYD